MLAVAAAIAMLGQALRGTDVSRPELISAVKSYKPGEPFLVGIRFTMKPGWHVYWQNPGDSGQEVRVKWTLPIGWKASKLLWPKPEVLTDTGLTTYVYPSRVTLLARLTPPNNARQARIVAHLDWLVCERICLPAKTDLSISLTGSGLGVENPSVARGLSAELRSLPKPMAPNRATATLLKDSVVLTFKLSGPTYTMYRFLPSDFGVVQNQPRTVATTTGSTVTLRLPKSDYFNVGTTRLRGIVEGIGNTKNRHSSFFNQIDVELKSRESLTPTSRAGRPCHLEINHED